MEFDETLFIKTIWKRAVAFHGIIVVSLSCTANQLATAFSFCNGIVRNYKVALPDLKSINVHLTPTPLHLESGLIMQAAKAVAINYRHHTACLSYLKDQSKTSLH